MTETSVHHLSIEDLLFAVRHRQGLDQMFQDRDPPAGADLVPRLRQLCLLAEQSGAGAEWITKTADAVIAALLSSQQIERDNIDPRRRRSQAQAVSLARSFKDMRRAGFTPGDAVAALRERTGLSRSRMYGLLKISKSCDFMGQNTG
jgi:hypothetical protein